MDNRKDKKLKQNKEIYNPKWNHYAVFWRFIEYPWRPNSKELITFYERQIREYTAKKPNPKILIFGCTPETRDLCSKLKLNVTLFDVNESMYQGMNLIMKRKPFREKLVLGKWENVTKYFKNNQFDVIFGDTIHCNLNLKTWDKHFKDISKILKKEGLYFFSEWCMDFEKKLSFAEVIKKYKKDKKYFNSFKNRLYIFYQMILGEDCYDWARRSCMFGKARKKFKDYAKKNKIASETLEKIWIVGPDFKSNWFGDYMEVDPPSGEIYELIFPHFWVKERFIDNSHPVLKFRRDAVMIPKK